MLPPMPLDARSLLPETYTLLSELLTDACPQETYRHALNRVLQAAQDSENAGFPLALLPLLTCQASGGNPEQAIPVAAAWRALHIGLKLLDDVEDGDIDRMGASIDAAQVLNLSTGFIAAAHLALTHLPPTQCAMLQADFLRTMLHMAAGQHVDLSRSATTTVETYFQVMEAKSGAFFALAAAGGATCATTDAKEIARYQEFGYSVGMSIQIADDWSDLCHADGGGDLATGQFTLPVFYALAVASPTERVRLHRLLAYARTNLEAEMEARNLMAMLGCEIYMQAELARYRRRALAALHGAEGMTLAVRPLHDWFVTLHSAAK
jgi:geranylgeranyl pyrophosphate synthase